jgi:hypothetical protein
VDLGRSRFGGPRTLAGVPDEGHVMTDIGSLFNLQAKSRRNARRAVQSLVAHRQDREEADRAVRAAADVPATSPLDDLGLA